MDRTLLCPAWLELPQIEPEPGFAARRGTGIHVYVTSAYDGDGRALDRVPVDFRNECSAIETQPLFDYLSKLTTVRFRTEVALAYDVETEEGRELGKDMGREYGVLPDSTIPGSADFFAIDDIREVGYVVDVKTGQEVSPPASNGQLLALAVAAAKAHGLDRVFVALAYHSAQTGDWRFVEAYYTSIEIDIGTDRLRDAYVRRLQARAAIASGLAPDVHPTPDACRYCPCIKSCPSSTGLVRHLPTELETLSDTMRSMTEEQLGAGWPVYQRMKKLVEAIGEEYEAIVREVSLPLPNGKLLVMGETHREYLRHEEANAVLAEHYGADIAMRAMRSTISKESLKAAVGRDQFERALMLIRDAGGVDSKVSFSLREEKVK